MRPWGTENHWPESFTTTIAFHRARKWGSTHQGDPIALKKGSWEGRPVLSPYVPPSGHIAKQTPDRKSGGWKLWAEGLRVTSGPKAPRHDH